MTRTAWQICGVAILLAVVWAHGMTKGKAWVQADWEKANVAAERAAQQQAEKNHKTALDAAARFESTRQRLSAENKRARDALSVALRAPISCDDKGAPYALADLPLPPAVFDRLRQSANDRGPD
jgi:hypothetical protein